METMPSPRTVLDALEVIGPDAEHELTGGRSLGDLEAEDLRAIVAAVDERILT